MPDENELNRLTALYHDMSDTQLLDLHADAANLTDEAQDVLRAEIRSRRLVVPTAEEADESKPPEYVPDLVTGLNDDGLVALITFYNGLDLGLACDHLGDAGIELAVKPFPGTDVSAAAFQIRVAPADQARAEEILRQKMGLFPKQEVEDDDSGEQELAADIDMVILGEFPDEDETAQTTAALGAAGIIYRMTPPYDDGENDAPGYTVEVHAGDLDRGLAVVADALGLK
jgi:hypothetical protein